MATRGARPKPTALRLVSGNAGKRPIPANDPRPGGAPAKPKDLTGRASELWDLRIAPAFWLAEADTDKAAMWCLLQAEFYKSKGKMIAARIGQLRALGSELGFDPSSRTRLGASGGKPEKKDDPASEFFG